MHRTSSAPQWGFGLPSKSSNTINNNNMATSSSCGGFGQLAPTSSWSTSFSSSQSGHQQQPQKHSRLNSEHLPRQPLQSMPLNQVEAISISTTANSSFAASSASTATTTSSTASTRVKQGELQDQHFERQSVLGRGGSATVYDALHQPSNTRVALKEIGKEYIKARTHQGYDVALREEINLHRSLKHPNVVRLYTYFSTRDSVVLVMEPCLEGTLYDYLQRYSENNSSSSGGSSSMVSCSDAYGNMDDFQFQTSEPPLRLPSGLPLREVRRILRQVANALHYLHVDQGVVHRDLKLENLLMHSDGQIRLADFGWARRLSDLQRPKQPLQRTSSCAATFGRSSSSMFPQSAVANPRPSVAPIEQTTREVHRLTICGTLDYMAPEIMSSLLAQHEAAADDRSRAATHHRSHPSNSYTTASTTTRASTSTTASAEWTADSISGVSSIYGQGEPTSSQRDDAPQSPTPRASRYMDGRVSDVHATRGSSVLRYHHDHDDDEDEDYYHPKYSPATDAWSFGCIVHELVLGLPPFFRENRKATAFAIVQEDPGFTNHNAKAMARNTTIRRDDGGDEEDDAPPPALSPWRSPQPPPPGGKASFTCSDVIPPGAVEILSACLSKNPSERPTMQQLLQHPFLQR